ncbi:MAG TPA: DivIVA domain-containing protein [Acidimicrobiales bacterium]|nr:DivIVA domain-containing protein [Acidimicrobiales bacterium]
MEFRDRLRGYDTDEVDEFLEKVAIGVDELHEEISSLQGRADRAERQMETLPPTDDDSLRRTLVLAQRTADLAIHEAREEAARLLEQARSQADGMLSEARQSASAMRSEAERDLQARVEHLGEEHDRLTRQIGVLTSLVDGERTRITEALSSLLGFVGDALSVSPELAEGSALPGYRSDAEEGDRYGDSEFGSSFSDFTPPETSGQPYRHDDDPLDLGLPDVEAELGEDAAIAFGGARELDATEKAPAELDPDEELWSRWASAEGDEKREGGETFRFGRREDDEPS